MTEATFQRLWTGAARIAVGGVLVCGARPLVADEFHLKASASDAAFGWQSAGSYEEGVVPSAGDTVRIPSGMTVPLAANDLAFANTLGRITPMDGSVLEVFVPEGEEWNLSVPVTCYGIWEAQKQDGKIRKTGAGTLHLVSCGRVMHGVQYADYYCSSHVVEGSLTLPTLPDGEKTLYCRGAVVEEGAWLYTAPIGRTALWGGLGGSGCVTNASAGASRPILDIYARSGDARSSFSGRLCGAFALYAWSGFDLVGASDSKSVTVVVNNGADMGVGQFGTRGGASAFGDADLNFVKTGAIRYLGGGETTDRIFYFGPDSTVDAGAGGLTFTGHWGSNGQDGSLCAVTLSGTNTEFESVLDNSFYAAKDGGALRLVKKGTGIWRLKDNALRRNVGVVAVEEGTLRFDSIAEAGEICSLGLSTALYGAVSGTANDAVRVPYAYLLGGTDAVGDVTDGLMEYSGTSAGYCASRLFAIRTKGGVYTSAGSAPIRLNGFTAADAGEKTLVLDGDNMGENVAAGITNGPGVVSILKRGSGTWYLDGARDFSGTVTVEGGTLVARTPTHYSWYRFTIRETGFATDSTTGNPSDFEQRSVDCRELALYDADGNPLEMALVGSNENYRAIQPGEYGYWHDGWENQLKASSSAKPLGELFSGQVRYGLYQQFPKTPRESDSTSWVPIVFRLSADSKPIVRFDLYFAHKGEYTPYCNRQPTSFALEGSMDGFVWDELFATNGVAYGAAAQWVSNEETAFYSPRKDKGFPVASGNGQSVFALGNATGVAVKGGATLRVEGEARPLTSLTIDCVTGVGKISGVTLAAHGTLVILNVPREGFVPIDFSGIAGWENLAGWEVALPGVKTRRLVDVCADGLRIRSSGGLLVVR